MSIFLFVEIPQRIISPALPGIGPGKLQVFGSKMEEGDCGSHGVVGRLFLNSHHFLLCFQP